jgi:hypothetical protein
MLAHSIYLVRGVMEPLLKGAPGRIIPAWESGVLLDKPAGKERMEYASYAS